MHLEKSLKKKEWRMKRLLKCCYSSEKGFTLIEVLVVVCIVAFLASVAGLNVIALTEEAKAESYDFELNNVRTAVKAMLVESTTGRLDADVVITNDMTVVTVDSGAKKLSNYMYGLDANGKIRSGCMYAFTIYGEVTQMIP